MYGKNTHSGNLVICLSGDLMDDKLTFTQVMARCHQAISYYLNQCWPSFITAYSISRDHYNDVIMSVLSSQIISLAIVYSTVYSRQRSNKTSKLSVTDFCEGNSLVTSEFPPHKGPVPRKMFPFDDILMDWVMERSREKFDSLSVNNHVSKHYSKQLKTSIY